MEKMKTIQMLIGDLYEKIDEVSIDTIAPRISEEKLWNWCGAWQRDARAILNDIEREVFDDSRGIETIDR